MIRTTHKKVVNCMESFLKNRISFTYKQTNQRIELFSAVGNYTNKESEFPISELNFIQRVKKHIIDNELYDTIDDIIPNRFKKNQDPVNIKYFQYNKRYKSGSRIDQCFEIDLKSAYWETAYKLGILPDDIYWKGRGRSFKEAVQEGFITKSQFDKCNTGKVPLTWRQALEKKIISLTQYEKVVGITKKSRLAAIGSLAKKTKHYAYDGKTNKQILVRTDRSILTEHLWDVICQRVEKLMSRVANECGKDFIFFWVDAMFVSAGSVRKVQAAFKAAGYECKVDKCKHIEFDDRAIKVVGKGHYAIIDGTRTWSEERLFPYNDDVHHAKPAPSLKKGKNHK